MARKNENVNEVAAPVIYAVALESTGTDIESEILRISIVDIDTQQVILDQYFSPSKCSAGTWQNVYKWSGITPSLVEGKPCLKTNPDVRASLSAILCEANWIVAYSGNMVMNLLSQSGVLYPPVYSVQDAFVKAFSQDNGQAPNRYPTFKSVRDVLQVDPSSFDYRTPEQILRDGGHEPTFIKARAAGKCFQVLSQIALQKSPLGM